MKHLLTKRVNALICLMLIAALCLSGAVAEQPEAAPAEAEEAASVYAVEVEEIVDELSGVELVEVSDATAEEPPKEEIPTDETQQGETPVEDNPIDETVVEEPPVDEEVVEEEDPDAVPGYETVRFTETQAVSGVTWTGVNLVRAQGFEGKLAVVTGRLVLNNVLIAGVPASQVDLNAWFDLSPKASIGCINGDALSINTSAVSINKKDTFTPKLTWNGKSVSNKNAKWKSSNTKVATVAANGKVTAKGKGTVNITATYKNTKIVLRMVVTNIIYPTSVTVNKKSLTASLNNVYKITANVKPTNAVDRSVVWSSSNPKVATVDENGVISALGVGKATIKATAINGKSASCKVTVKVVAPKKVDFNQLYVTMNPGKTLQTTVAVSPKDTSNPLCRYTSSNPEVATVDEMGVVTALSCGTTTITAVCAAKTSIKNTCKVCVIEPGSKRLEGVIIGLNPGHQTKTIAKLYPIAPGSKTKAKGVKVGTAGKWTRVPEYETVLQVGLKLQRILTEEGATVVMTRTRNDVSLTNIQRAQMLNNAGVDVAIQIHINGSKNTSLNGTSTYYKTTGSWVEESCYLANCLLNSVSANAGSKRLGVRKYNKYMSLNWTTTPTCLIELGYASNKKEDYLLVSDAYREKLAYGLYEGLCTYFGR